jgi:hypothetical protein
MAQSPKDKPELMPEDDQEAQAFAQKVEDGHAAFLEKAARREGKARPPASNLSGHRKPYSEGQARTLSAFPCEGIGDREPDTGERQCHLVRKIRNQRPSPLRRAAGAAGKAGRASEAALWNASPDRSPGRGAGGRRDQKTSECLKLGLMIATDLLWQFAPTPTCSSDILVDGCSPGLSIKRA